MAFYLPLTSDDLKRYDIKCVPPGFGFALGRDGASLTEFSKNRVSLFRVRAGHSSLPPEFICALNDVRPQTVNVCAVKLPRYDSLQCADSVRSLDARIVKLRLPALPGCPLPLLLLFFRAGTPAVVIATTFSPSCCVAPAEVRVPDCVLQMSPAYLPAS
jgi:hypothetical protein